MTSWIALNILLVALFAASCGNTGDGDGNRGTTGTRVTGSTVNINPDQGKCSIVLVVFNEMQEIRGDAGATVTVGDKTVTFSPNCTATQIEPAPVPVIVKPVVPPPVVVPPVVPAPVVPPVVIPPVVVTPSGS